MAHTEQTGPQLTIVRARLTSDEWVRMRQLALGRNESSADIIGRLIREFVDTHNPNREEKA